MPRKPRENLAGGIYHVYSRGNSKSVIYLDDIDRHLYLRRLERVVKWAEWLCLAYCQMDTHVHLLLETPQGNLSAGMHRLQGAYTQAFNARHGRSGHLFQGRFGAVRITSDRQLLAVAAYLARNPVEANICRHPADWRWSSFRHAIFGGGPSWLATSQLLAYFAAEGEVARREYSEISTR